MNTLAVEPLAIRVTFDADTMWVDLADGRRLGVPIAYFPRLLRATPAQRQRCVISGGGIGLHWDDLDEDILVSALLLGAGDRSRFEQPEAAAARDRKAQA
jgi:hypothetical protein